MQLSLLAWLAVASAAPMAHVHHQHRPGTITVRTHSTAVAIAARETASKKTQAPTETEETEPLETDAETESYGTDAETESPGTETETTAQAITALPRVSTTSQTLPTLSTSSASPTYTYKARVPQSANPYIQRLSLPTNSVFIVVAGVLGLLTASVVVASLAIWLDSRRKAKRDREVQYYNPFAHVHEKGVFSDSSLASASSASTLSTSQGRAYREMLVALKTAGNRTSMTISPVFEMMQNSNASLPLLDSLASTPDLMAHERRSTTDLLRMDGSGVPDGLRRTRPPSQLLDDLLLGIEFGEEYPRAK